MTGPAVRFGVVGLGIGRWHVEEISKLPDAVVTAVCDRDPGRREGVRRRYGIPAAEERIEDLLARSDVDAVVVALPNHLHEPAVLAAFDAGKHVLCEKPLGRDAAAARRMAAAAADHPGLQALVAMKFRFDPRSRALRRLVEDGAIGTVYHGFNRYIRPAGGGGIPEGWFRRKETAGGGALIDNGVHLLDLNWFLMGRPRPLLALGRCHDRIGRRWDPSLDVEDFACGLLTFEDGSAIVLENGWAAYVERELFEVRVLGDRGGMEFTSGKYWTHSGDRYVERSVQETGGPNQWRHFVDCIRGETENLSPFSDGARVSAMLEAIYESHRQGGAARVADVPG